MSLNKIIATKIASGVLLMSVSAASIGYIAAGHDKKAEVASKQSLPAVTDTLPADFFNTVPPLPKKVDPPKPVPIVREEELLTAIPVRTVPVISDDERLVQRLQKKRLKAGSVKLIDYGDESDETVKLKETVLPSVDKDFSANDEPRTDPTFPVDLQRVIPVTKFIPAILYTELRSELASEKVIARIENDIVGFHGRLILIPKGSQAVGRYKPVKKQGDTRISIEFYRIITPEGIDIQLGSEVADSEGASGITGEIDNRWKDRYGAALLISTINAGAQMSIPIADDKDRAAANAFTTPVGQVTAQLLQQSMQLEPRVRIPKGTRITISPLTDIWFKEPKGSIMEAIPVPAKDPGTNIEKKN